MKKLNPKHETIIKLRKDGLSYGAIADVTGLSRNTITTICRRADIKVTDLENVIWKDEANVKLCECCGQPFINPWNRTGKRFCSKACHTKWWNDKRCEEARLTKKDKQENKNSP